MAVAPNRINTRDAARRIRDFIVSAADGTLAAGARLPTERELSRRFAVPRHAITIVAGAQSRAKVVEVAGVTAAELRSKLNLTE